MYEKERLSIKTKLDNELISANILIDELSSITEVATPESTLGDIRSFDPMNKEEACQIQLKLTYRKKRKLLWMLECLDNINSFLCNSCGKEIGIERLLIMPNARLCSTCVDAA